MKNKAIVIIIIFLLLAAGAAVFFAKKAGGKNTGGQDRAEIVLFYRTTCPHCQNVEKFLAEKQAAQRIKYDMKNIDASRANYEELVARARTCKIDLATLGVPFLYDGAACFMGNEKVIEFFQTKLGK